MFASETLELLYRIDDGYHPTKDERRRLNNVETLFIHDSDNLRNELPMSMYYLKHLEEIAIFEKTSLTSLEPLSKIKTLKRIRIWIGSSVSNISTLENNSNLEVLVIGHSPISDISVLSKLKKLKCVSLRETRITDISSLAQLSDLEELNIIETGVTSIAPIKSLPKLKELYLYDAPIEDLINLSTMPSLHTLGVNGPQTCHPDFGKWISQVTVLNLTNSPISDLSSLYPCTNLESLQLISTNVHTLPTWLGHRMPLKQLALINNDLHDIPGSLLELNLPFKMKYAHFLDEEGFF